MRVDVVTSHAAFSRDRKKSIASRPVGAHHVKAIHAKRRNRLIHYERVSHLFGAACAGTPTWAHRWVFQASSAEPRSRYPGSYGGVNPLVWLRGALRALWARDVNVDVAPARFDLRQ